MSQTYARTDIRRFVLPVVAPDNQLRRDREIIDLRLIVNGQLSDPSKDELKKRMG